MILHVHALQGSRKRTVPLSPRAKQPKAQVKRLAPVTLPYNPPCLNAPAASADIMAAAAWQPWQVAACSSFLAPCAPSAAFAPAPTFSTYPRSDVPHQQPEESAFGYSVVPESADPALDSILTGTDWARHAAALLHEGASLGFITKSDDGTEDNDDGTDGTDGTGDETAMPGDMVSVHHPPRAL